MPGEATEDGPKAWTPATHVGDPGWSSWLLPVPTLAVATIWDVHYQMEDVFVSPSFSVNLPFK